MSARAGTPEERFEAYVHRLGTVLGHADRLEPLRGYLTGLLLLGERKSVEPMAAKLDPTRVRARHQALHHFVASSAWDAEAVLAVARDYALEQLERHGPVEAWVVDDTGFPKKGTHSVGVTRQYCGPLGKQDNCQVAVTLSLCSSVMSVPSAYRLYLPESWAGDAARRRAAGCGGRRRVLAYQKEGSGVGAIVEHLGLPMAGARLAPARGPQKAAGC